MESLMTKKDVFFAAARFMPMLLTVFAAMTLGCGTEANKGKRHGENEIPNEDSYPAKLEESLFPKIGEANTVSPGTTVHVHGSFTVPHSTKKSIVCVVAIYRKDPNGTKTIVENVAGEARRNARGSFEYSIPVKVPDIAREYEVQLQLVVGENGTFIDVGQISVRKA
jgi:hypothetical protein